MMSGSLCGILGCLELVFDIDYFASRRTADVWTVIPLITCVLIFCCFVVSTMLNVSRIASSVEKLVDKQDSGDSRVTGETVKKDNE